MVTYPGILAHPRSALLRNAYPRLMDIRPPPPPPMCPMRVNARCRMPIWSRQREKSHPHASPGRVPARSLAEARGGPHLFLIFFFNFFLPFLPARMMPSRKSTVCRSTCRTASQGPDPCVLGGCWSTHPRGPRSSLHSRRNSPRPCRGPVEAQENSKAAIEGISIAMFLPPDSSSTAHTYSLIIPSSLVPQYKSSLGNIQQSTSRTWSF